MMESLLRVGYGLKRKRMKVHHLEDIIILLILNLIIRNNPAWTIPGKYPGKEPDRTPGPGEYSIKDKEGQGITMKGRYNIKEKIDEVPGPGNYNINVLHGHPGVKIQERHPSPRDNNEVPGPGNYTLPDNNSNPKWTIQGKNIPRG
mmetsp:Transcript_9826/g.8658  ORF Transcript_9826/g.8658 Transcript_9826/m.8658 type:complete len:146 (-) Transcript_9826:2672-3109(-)